MGQTGCPQDGLPSGKVVSSTACTWEHQQAGWAAPGAACMPVPVHHGNIMTGCRLPLQPQSGAAAQATPAGPPAVQVGAAGPRLAFPATHRPRETQQGLREEGGWFTFPCQQHPLGSLSGYRRQGLKSSGKVPGKTERGLSGPVH